MIVRVLLRLWLLTIPFGTVWIFQEIFVGGAKWEYGTLVWYVSEGLLWLAAGVWWWTSVRPAGRFLVGVKKWPLFVWLVFFLYLGIGAVWSAAPLVTLQILRFVFDGFLAFWLIRTADESAKPALWFGLGMIVVALIGIGQFLLQKIGASVWLGIGSHLVAAPGTSVVVTADGARVLRAYGTFSHPNIFGGYLALALVAWSTLKPAAKIIWRIFYWVGFIILVAALFMTFSRSAWLVTLLVSFVALVLSFKKIGWRPSRKIIAAGVLIFVILSAVFSTLVFTRVAITSSHEITSLTERWDGIAAAQKLWRMQPLTGVGLGAYTAAAIKAEPGQTGWVYQPVHMIWWLLLVEIGVVGIVLLGVALTITFWKSWRLHFWPLIFVTLGILIIGSVDHYLISLYAGWIWLGLAFGLSMHK